MNKRFLMLLGAVLAISAPQVAIANTSIITTTCAPGVVLGVKPGVVVMTPEGLRAEPTAASVARQLYNDESYKGVITHCTEQHFVETVINNNGPGPYRSDQPINLPVRIDVTTTVTTTAAPASVVQATPVVLAPPATVVTTTPVVVDNTPQIRQAQTRITEMQREHVALQRALAQRPKVTWTKAELDRVGGLASAIATAQRDITALKAAVALKADKSYVDTQDTALRGSVNAAQTTANQALAAANAKSDGGLTGWKWWAYYVGLPLLALVALLAAVAAWLRAGAAVNGPVGLTGTEVDNKMTAKLNAANFATKAELDGLASKTEVDALSERIEDIGHQTGVLDIRFSDAQLLQLRELNTDGVMPVNVVVDGEDMFVIRFKRLADGNYVVDEPQTRFRNHSPASPIKDPLKFVRRNYKQGEFSGFVAPEAAAA